MDIIPTTLTDIVLIKPKVFHDERGYFCQSYQQRDYERVLGRPLQLVQDNVSFSHQRVLRGLHYQLRQPQAKLISVSQGEIFDVAVDLRPNSASFGRWCGYYLSAENQLQMWIPEGFAHGFLVTSPAAQVHYKTSDYYAPDDEHCICWNDPDLSIHWPLTAPPLVSAKDAAGVLFRKAEYYPA